jgi:hypothetical protein
MPNEKLAESAARLRAPEFAKYPIPAKLTLLLDGIYATHRSGATSRNSGVTLTM